MNDDVKLQKYTVFLELTVWGETPTDALEYVNTAIDVSDLLEQDGIIGIRLIDDPDSVELSEEYDEDSDEEREY